MSQLPNHPWLEVEQIRGVTVVRFSHPLADEDQWRLIGKQLVHFVADLKKPKLVLNFNQVEKLPSVMVGTLLQIQAGGGQLALCGLNPEIHDLLQALRINQFFQIFGQEPEALQAFPRLEARAWNIVVHNPEDNNDEEGQRGL